MHIRLAGWLLFFFITARLGAQNVSCPTNIDFELGNFTNWYLYTGKCCPINTPSLSGAVANRHVITSGIALDKYGRFPISDTSKGFFSLKLGNDRVGAQAERARYYVRVPANTNNYSLLLKYAVVLENPSHKPSEQPRFEVNAYDSLTGNPITCAQFSFVASSVLPGFTLSSVAADVYYKPWSMASLNLSGYAGKTVAVDFASGDCDLGQHFGYGYIDVNCVLFAISAHACKGTLFTNMTAPPGFESYRWYDSTFTILIDTNQIAQIPTPPTFNKYHVILKAYPGYGCDDTLSTTIYRSDVTLKMNKDTTTCFHQAIQLRDSVSASARFLPLTYLWAPATNLSCSTCLNPVVTADANLRYQLSVTDVNGCVISDSMLVSVRRDSITQQPTGNTLCKNQPYTFRVKVGGYGGYSYQWKKNGIALPLATADSLRIAAVASSDTGNYQVIVKWGCDSISSLIAKLSIYPSIQIQSQPSNVAACPGTTASMRVKASGRAPLTYQWRRNQTNISSAVNDSLFFNNVSAADTGWYYAIVYTGCDTLASDSAHLTFQNPVQIIQQPQPAVVCQGSSTTFKVIATGSGTVSYQWSRNGVPLIGKIADSLALTNIGVSDSGTYQVLITTACGSVSSQTVTLQLSAVPIMVKEPDSLVTCLGNAAKLKVKALGANFFQWYHNGVMTQSSVADSVVFPALSYADTGTWNVRIIGSCDSIDSRLVSINILPPTSILVQPKDTHSCDGKSISLMTIASSQGAIAYQWFFNNQQLPGATKDSLTIANLNPATVGSYFVRVYGPCDSATSAIANVYTDSNTQLIADLSNAFLCAGDSLNLKTSATGSGNISYDWIHNGNLLSFNHSDTLIRFPVSLADTGTYQVIAAAACGVDSSSLVSVQLNIPISFSIQPSDIVTCSQQPSFVSVKGTGYNALQWYHNNVPVSGANADTFWISNTVSADTGLYYCIAKGSCDSLYSDTINISMKPPGTIIKQPISTGVCANTRTGFYTRVSGTPPLIYQWYKNGSLLPGAILDSLIIPSTQVGDTGYYQLKVVTGCDSLFTDSVRLDLLSLPTLQGGNNDKTACPGDSFELSISVAGGTGVSFQWTHNGQPMAGKTNSNLLVYPVTANDTGSYLLILNSACGIQNTPPVRLSLAPPPGILQQPANAAACLGKPVVLTVAAQNKNAVQWYHNATIISGATTDTLLLGSIQYADTGNYMVVVEGNCMDIPSNNAAVNAWSPPVGNLPDNMQVCTNNNIVSMPGFFNYQWSTGDTGATVNVNTSGKLSVSFTDIKGCLAIDSTMIALLYPATAQVQPDTILCNEIPLLLQAAVSNTDSLIWSTSAAGYFDNANLSSTKFHAAPGTAGVFAFTLKAYNTCGEVQSTFQADWRNKTIATFNLSDTLVCEGAPAILATPDVAGGLLSGPFLNGNTFTPSTPGKYELKYVIEQYGCIDSQYRTVEVLHHPVARFTFLPMAPTIDFPVTFTSGSDYAKSLLWSFGNGNTATGTVADFHFKEEGDYNILLTAINEICTDTTTKQIHILGSNFIWAPNAFTPGLDGLNDLFHIIYRNSKGGVLRIYNRYGEMIYEANNFREGWDGTYNGTACPAGVYVFVADYLTNDNEWKSLKGNVTLLR